MFKLGTVVQKVIAIVSILIFSSGVSSAMAAESGTQHRLNYVHIAKAAIVSLLKQHWTVNANGPKGPRPPPK